MSSLHTSHKRATGLQHNEHVQHVDTWRGLCMCRDRSLAAKEMVLMESEESRLSRSYSTRKCRKMMLSALRRLPVPKLRRSGCGGRAPPSLSAVQCRAHGQKAYRRQCAPRPSCTACCRTPTRPFSRAASMIYRGGVGNGRARIATEALGVFPQAQDGHIAESLCGDAPQWQRRALLQGMRS